ncbi:helix-turn-helix transcriptional regulator [Parapusillimonas granuli]|uniref:Helix-turn-helix transcriptional regulator n=1 Tax=Parapusillimonas granuli TaxID=380911 RepID=A0A853FZB3_9BURK|nr:helix-turn-helix transcriptional regulator [Parapusillimonas granuli]
MGEKIRAARKAGGVTLLQLAERSGVSLASLSKAERGLIALSYEKFLAVSQALALDLTDLFHKPSGKGVRERMVVDRVNEAVIYKADRYLYGMLATEWPQKKMTPMYGKVEPGKPVNTADFSRHAGEEFIFVISGSLTMQFENGESRTLHAHDSIYFDSGLGHHYLCASADAVEILVVCVNESNEPGTALAEPRPWTPSNKSPNS